MNDRHNDSESNDSQSNDSQSNDSQNEIQATDQIAADQTVDALENIPMDRETEFLQSEILLGEEILKSQTVGMPAANPDLHSLLTTTLESSSSGNGAIDDNSIAASSMTHQFQLASLPPQPAETTVKATSRSPADSESRIGKGRMIIGLVTAASLLGLAAFGSQFYALSGPQEVAISSNRVIADLEVTGAEDPNSGIQYPAPENRSDKFSLVAEPEVTEWAGKPNPTPLPATTTPLDSASGRGFSNDFTLDFYEQTWMNKSTQGRLPADQAKKGGYASNNGFNPTSARGPMFGPGGGDFGGKSFPPSPKSPPSRFDDEEYRFNGIKTEGKSNEQYERLPENQFSTTKGASALSTFSIDVDTASYTNMRRFVMSGQRVPAGSVRIEEFVNYFEYDYPQPKGKVPFSVNMELAACPWNDGHKLLRVGLKGKDVHRDERPASNTVFLLDVSGSMQSEDKLPLLKAGFQIMVRNMNENDRISIVTYAGSAGVVLKPTSGDQKDKIMGALQSLTAGGSTNGSEGINLAYQLAQENFIKDGTNKVILATDGDLNVGITADQDLVSLIKEKASEGVFLSVLGFGTGNLKDAKMEKLADNGNGMYSYIDGVREAHKVLVENMSGSLVTIAKDVKIQIEFNPAEVKAYRLIGYENRVLAAKDFDDDRKDAGEIGAGHTVTALYELVTSDSPAASVAPTGLKYQQSGEDKVKDEPKPKNAGELLTLALRYKQPDAHKSERIEFTLENEVNSFSAASSDFRFAASVASFGMLLRGSQFSGSTTAGWIRETAAGAIGEDKSGYRSEFVDLVRRHLAPR